MRAREAVALHEGQHLLQAREQAELAAKRVPAEEQVEHGGQLVARCSPVGVGHGDLVHVCEQWAHEVTLYCRHGGEWGVRE